MSNVSLTVKPIAGDGTTSYIDGNYLPAAELQADLDAIINGVNGNLDETNLHASTQIPNSKLVDIAMTKVLDLADDIATYITTTTPGDTASPSLPATLAAEMQRLRYRMAASRQYSTNVYYMNSSAVATAAGWFEPPPMGRNLLPNAGFEIQSGAANSAPDGWNLVSTPATVAIESPAHTGTGLEKRSLNIVTNGSNEGISVDVAGLKVSTKYLVGMAYSITDNGTVAGTVGLYTSNGLSSGNYQNLALTASTEAAGTVAVINGIVKSNATPSAITVSIYATNAGADFNIHSVWMYELGEGYPDELPSIPTQTATDITAATLPTSWTGSGNAWRTDTLTSLSLSQYIPFQGYRLTYEVSVPFADVDATDDQEGCLVYGAILTGVDGGATSVVRGPVCVYQRNDDAGADILTANTITMKYVLENPTPGYTYNFLFRLGVYDGSSYEQVSVPPVINTQQMEASATLTVERI